MNAIRKAAIAAATLGAAVALSTAAPAASNNPARGIVGNTLHGFEDDGEFYDYYAQGGAATSMLVGGETTHGQWSVKDGHLCISYPDDAPECFQVEVNGNTGSLTDVDNGNVFPVQIIKGNPNGL